MEDYNFNQNPLFYTLDNLMTLKAIGAPYTVDGLVSNFATFKDAYDTAIALGVKGSINSAVYGPLHEL